VRRFVTQREVSMTAKTRPPVPAALADVALIDGPTVAAAASISISQLYELVRTKAAPQPVIRAPRCTRWSMATVRLWLIQRAEHGLDEQASALVTAKAAKASAAAQAKRRTAAAQVGA